MDRGPAAEKRRATARPLFAAGLVWPVLALALVAFLLLALVVLHGEPTRETRRGHRTAGVLHDGARTAADGHESHRPHKPPRRPRMGAAKAVVERRPVETADDSAPEAPVVLPPRPIEDLSLGDRTETPESPLTRYSARASRTRGQPLLV